MKSISWAFNNKWGAGATVARQIPVHCLPSSCRRFLKAIGSNPVFLTSKPVYQRRHFFFSFVQQPTNIFFTARILWNRIHLTPVYSCLIHQNLGSWRNGSASDSSELSNSFFGDSWRLSVQIRCSSCCFFFAALDCFVCLSMLFLFLLFVVVSISCGNGINLYS